MIIDDHNLYWKKNLLESSKYINLKIIYLNKIIIYLNQTDFLISEKIFINV